MSIRKIVIENVKGISHLEFTMPQSEGVYLLVGANGMGKTTLLTCIDRIANPNAFATGFKSANADTGIDQYEDAVIAYEADNTLIRFRKKSRRWASTPKTKSSELLKEKFEYKNSVFIRADAKRLDVTQEEIRNGRTERASPELIVALNSIFETGRYLKLKRLKNVQGRGRQSTYFYILQDGEKRYSEKRFSTGEMAIIHLVERIIEVEDHTLFLLDEAELALHPRIQKNLLDYIQRKAKQKSLTVFIATHSVTMIKACDPQHIMLLRENGGRNEISTPCYPAEAIGSVDYESNNIYDTVIFVEDDMARMLLKSMIKQYMMKNPDKAGNMYDIEPVGGYEQTAVLAKNVKNRVLKQSRVFALLDEDAKTDGLAEKGGNTEFKKLYDSQEHDKRFIFFLPCTPEVWFVYCLENAGDELKRMIKETYHCEAAEILHSPEYRACNAQKPRRLAKQKFDVFIRKCTESSGDDINVTTAGVIDLLVDKCMKPQQLMSTLGPIFEGCNWLGQSVNRF